MKTTDFRCFGTVEFEPHAQRNLIYGANASGKTSILEAIAYLGRGKSFRGASAQDLIRNGCREFVLFGRALSGSRPVTIGVRNNGSGLEVHVDETCHTGAAVLAEELPLQVVDPEVHNLVAGGPELRRRYLDWIAFHVEQGYLERWRRFRRALKQRNAALRAAASDELIMGWNREFLIAARSIHKTRQAMVAVAQDVFQKIGRDFLETTVGLVYRQGWNNDCSLEEALVTGLRRDREHGGTHVGPHRGDVKLMMDERQAKKLVSRGQQKLLACAMIFTAVELVQSHLERPLLLLLDDPAAELDSASLQRLMFGVAGLGCQVVATALAPDKRLFSGPLGLFHVEQGKLKKKA